MRVRAILVITFFFALLVWVGAALMDYFVLGEGPSLWGALVTAVPARAAFARLFGSSAVLLLGLIIARAVAQRDQAQGRVEHLNAMLRAIRDVNQLITQEKDRSRLIQAACEHLTATRGYNSAWIALLDESGRLEMAAQSGLPEASWLPLVERLRSGELPPCARKALAEKGVLAIADVAATCGSECPLSGTYRRAAARSVRLEHDQQVYGLLTVSLPRAPSQDADERSLLCEVARDIGLALHSIALKEEHTRSIRALEESEERYRGLFERVPLGLYRTTPAGRILDANRGLLEMLGYEDRESLFAVNVADLYADSKERERELAASEQAEVLHYETRLRRRDGKVIWALDTFRVLRDDSGKTLCYEGSLEDITERKHLEEQFRQAQRMEAVGRLAGGVAHDFNNLLTVINGYSQVLLSEMDQDDPLCKDVEQIRQAGERAATLTRQLLAFSRRQVLDMRVINLNDVIEGMSKMLRRVIGEDITLELRLAPNLGSVRADPGQIEQVVMNLAVNARDAMPTGGELSLSTANFEIDREFADKHPGAMPGSYVMFSVTDTGHGMTPEVKAHLFEPFFTTKKPGEGTGLGLATAYGIVKQSGGNIYAYSEPGLGTSFKVYLPRVNEPPAVAPTAERGEMLEKGTETILVVEDQEEVRELATRMLRHLGYQVLEAARPAEALALAKGSATPIALVLTDVVMPEMSGRALVEQLRQVCGGLRALYMSGYPGETIIRHAMLQPGFLFIQKPFTIQALAQKVREALRSRPV